MMLNMSCLHLFICSLKMGHFFRVQEKKLVRQYTIIFAIENTPEDSPIYPGGILNVPVNPGKATSPKWRHLF